MLKVVACVLVFFSVIWASENPEYLRAVHENREYFIFSHEVDYLQAIARCKKLGWTLATERNDVEVGTITMLLEIVNFTSTEYYLGGIHQLYKDEDMWMWLETAEEISYSNWVSGEPKDGQNCLLRESIESSGNWTSSDCTVPHSFICQPIGQ